MQSLITPEQIGRMLDSLDRIAAALEAATSLKVAELPELPPALAYRWQVTDQLFSRSSLVSVNTPQLISFNELRNVDQQKEKIYNNTLQFVRGYPSNNVLLTGARGTGKSSLVRACLQEFHPEGLRLIEVEKQHLQDLPVIVDCLRHRSERFIIFCDDLSFEDGEHSYKGLKTVLDGSVVSPSDNILVYATSNRRHLVMERMADNLERQQDEQGEIHPGDTLEEKVSLAERFGLTLRFYSFSQDEYLAAVLLWLQHFGGEMTNDIRMDALRWATQSGSRSGRIAWQFARDYAGKKMVETKNKTVI